MRFYLIPYSEFGYGLEPDDGAAQVLEGFVTLRLHSMGIYGRAEWYYDEFVEPIEYGVKIDIEDVDDETFDHLIDTLISGAEELCEEVEVEIP